MKKTIRLTESQLVDLVKKVIKEQDETGLAPKKPANFETINPKIQIKFKVYTKKGDQVYLIELDKIKKTADGCLFEGPLRGETKRQTLEYKCDGTVLWSKQEVDVTPEAGKMLSKACACSAYASAQKPGDGQSQLAEVAPEPIMNGRSIVGYFSFKEGQTYPWYLGDKPFSKANEQNAVDQIVGYLSKGDTLKVLQKFKNNEEFPLPKFIELHVGTSHSGSGEKNAAVAEGRLNFLKGLVTKAFDKMGIDSQVIKSIVVSNSNEKYDTSKLDKNFFDPKKVDVDHSERFGHIVIHHLTERGLDTKGIQNVQKGLNSASSVINTWVVDGVAEELVVKNILKLQSFSDIEDLSDSISAGGKWGGLEEFLNDQLFDDEQEMIAVGRYLSKLAKASGKQADTVRLFRSGGNYRISIGFGQ
jgi:hypothetical protein